jgi:hemoglobin
MWPTDRERDDQRLGLNFSGDGIVTIVQRPSIFEFAGGESAFLALAIAHHERCLRDPVLNHPFSHPGHPQHVERLASYWAEVFGGPPIYSQSCGGHSAMAQIHAGQGADAELGDRFVECFVQAADDAGLRDDAEFRRSLRSYMEWAVQMCLRTRRTIRSCRRACRCRDGPGAASRRLETAAAEQS